MHDRLSPTYIPPHDDGTWVRATLLSQHRVASEWRVTVAYAIDGFTFWRGMPAKERRPLGG